jgi:hypothetical protein
VCWFVSYFVFQLLLAVNDQRYFTFAVPAIVGLAVVLLTDTVSPVVRTKLGPALLAAGLVLAAFTDLRFSQGTVGYGDVSRFLATVKDSGNILVAAPEVSDFIFRYRAADPQSVRRVVRGDRTLAIRLSDYSGVDTKLVAHSAEDVRNVLQRGRVRYLITYASGGRFPQLAEDSLAHSVASTNQQAFQLLSTFPFLTDYDGEGRISVWRYTEPFAVGTPLLGALIPTAGLDLQCPTTPAR